MNLSVSSYTWLPASFLGKLGRLQNFGIESVEIFASPRHLDIRDAEEVQRAGIALREMEMRHVSMHAPSSVGDLSSPEESVRNDTVVQCQKALDAAMLMGAKQVTFHPSSIEGESSESAMRWPSLYETLRELSGYAEDRDIRITVENFPSPFFGDNPKELYDRIEELDLPNVGVCLDIGHAYVGGRIPEVIAQLGSKVYSIHASDNRGRVDEHLPPGQGSVPWEKVFEQLKAIDCVAPFVIEVRDGRKTDAILEDIVEFATRMGLNGVGQLSSH